MLTARISFPYPLKCFFLTQHTLGPTGKKNILGIGKGKATPFVAFSFCYTQNVFPGGGTLKGESLGGFYKNLIGLWQRHTIWLVLTLFTPFSILKRVGIYL